MSLLYSSHCIRFDCSIYSSVFAKGVNNAAFILNIIFFIVNLFNVGNFYVTTAERIYSLSMAVLHAVAAGTIIWRNERQLDSSDSMMIAAFLFFAVTILFLADLWEIRSGKASNSSGFVDEPFGNIAPPKYSDVVQTPKVTDKVPTYTYGNSVPL